MRDNIILLVLVLSICALGFYAGNKYQYGVLLNKQIDYKFKLDSLTIKHTKLLTADSSKHMFYKTCFFILKSEVAIDDRGYFYSKYYRKYKYTKGIQKIYIYDTIYINKGDTIFDNRQL